MKFAEFVQACNDFLALHPQSGDLYAIVRGPLHWQTADPPRFDEIGFWDGDGCPEEDEFKMVVRI